MGFAKPPDHLSGDDLGGVAMNVAIVAGFKMTGDTVRINQQEVSLGQAKVFLAGAAKGVTEDPLLREQVLMPRAQNASHRVADPHEAQIAAGRFKPSQAHYRAATSMQVLVENVDQFKWLLAEMPAEEVLDP